jgi:hypothetical protein
MRGEVAGAVSESTEIDGSAGFPLLQSHSSQQLRLRGRAPRSRRFQESARGGRPRRPRPALYALQRHRLHLRQSTPPGFAPLAEASLRCRPRRTAGTAARPTGARLCRSSRRQRHAPQRASRATRARNRLPTRSWNDCSSCQNASEKRSESFNLNRRLLAVGSPGNRPARPASDQPAQDGSSAADQRPEAHDDGPDTDKANRASREAGEAERHSPNLVPVKLLKPQRIQRRFHSAR